MTALVCTEENLCEMMAKVTKGDAAARSAFRTYIVSNPAFMKSNDLASHAERVLLEKITGGDQPNAETIFEERQKLMRRELVGEGATPLEGILIKRISVCWLQAYHADTVFLNTLSNGLSGTESAQKYQDRAHKRLLSAVKALAQVRRLQIPAVQVNIGEKQINVSG